jgi:hypothetical protein
MINAYLLPPDGGFSALIMNARPAPGVPPARRHRLSDQRRSAAAARLLTGVDHERGKGARKGAERSEQMNTVSRSG